VTAQLSSREAAALIGVAASTWRDYVADGRAPAPDGQIGSSNWWWQTTVEEWKATRPGRGARTDLLNIGE
jgi:predicted DNA-binding transcriptional regulator AlpA